MNYKNIKKHYILITNKTTQLEINQKFLAFITESQLEQAKKTFLKTNQFNIECKIPYKQNHLINIKTFPSNRAVSELNVQLTIDNLILDTILNMHEFNFYEKACSVEFIPALRKKL